MTAFQITYCLSDGGCSLPVRSYIQLRQNDNFLQRIWRMLHEMLYTTVCGAHSAREKEEIFLQITQEYADVITRICRSFASKESDFEDLMQDAHLNIWAGLDSFRGDSQLKTWIYRVTLNTCVATYRKQKRELTQVDIDQARGIYADTGNSFENSQWMNSLLSTLSPIDHSIVTMWLDDLSYDEIAEVMGMNRNTVATRLRRSKEKLAKVINR